MNPDRKRRGREQEFSPRDRQDWPNPKNDAMKRQRGTAEETDATDENLIYGRNALLEALKSEREIEKIFLRRGDREGSLRVIAALARERSVPFIEVLPQKLEEMTGGAAHQGVAALVSPVVYRTLDEILAAAEEKEEKPFLVLCDDISDPHNLGAILRSAECCGVNGVILPKRHSAPLTSVVAKASAGAIHHLPIAKVSNLAAAIETLKEKGVWIYGAEAGGTSVWESDMRGSTALVLGSEGNGLSRLVREKCDFIVSIPLYGKINSFNVSCAAAVLLSAAAEQRHSHTPHGS